MPYPLISPMSALHEHRITHRQTLCWKLTRQDMGLYRFTEHDRELVLPDGFTYTPTSGIDASASEATAGMDIKNTSYRGVIASSVITSEDIRSGLWSYARIDEYLVDWLYPWQGLLAHDVYWLADLSRFTEEVWEADVAGITTRLLRDKGFTYQRSCEWDFGQNFDHPSLAGCRFDVAAISALGETVDSVQNARRIFRVVNGSVSWVLGDLDSGTVTWISGNNAGVTSEIRTHLIISASNHSVELEIGTPADIVAGDICHIAPGCNGTFTRCKYWDNVVNRRGFPHMPGTDKLIETF